MHCLTGECEAIAEKKFQGLAGWGFGRDLRLVLGWPYFKCFQLWLCAFNASGKARIGGLVFDLGFDPVESGDLFQAFLRNGSGAG